MKESEILHKYSQEGLLEAVHESWYSNIRITAASEHGFFWEHDEYSLSGFQSNGKPDVGFCVRIESTPERCGPVIEETLKRFEEMGLPEMYYLTPLAKPGKAIEREMAARGFTRGEGFPVMWVDLHELKQDRPSPDGLTIERIRDDSGIDAFRDIYYEGFEENRNYIDYIAGGLKAYGYDEDAPLRSYLGYLDGEPVATSQLNLHGGVAGLYSVVVRPGARGKGLGTAMTLDTLKMGITEGYRYGILFATPMGIGIYRKIGFKELFTPLTYFRSGAH
jgi:ribosomal protein S18 acetylase RimI-like enzyme